MHTRGEARGRSGRGGRGAATAALALCLGCGISTEPVPGDGDAGFGPGASAGAGGTGEGANAGEGGAAGEGPGSWDGGALPPAPPVSGVGCDVDRACDPACADDLDCLVDAMDGEDNSEGRAEFEESAAFGEDGSGEMAMAPGEEIWVRLAPSEAARVFVAEGARSADLILAAYDDAGATMDRSDMADLEAVPRVVVPPSAEETALRLVCRAGQAIEVTLVRTAE